MNFDRFHKEYGILFSFVESGLSGVFRGPCARPNFCVGKVERHKDGWWYFTPKSEQPSELYYGKSRMEAVNSFFHFYGYEV